MFLSILNKIGFGNLGVFLGAYISNKISLIDLNCIVGRINDDPSVQNWLDIMFIISSTGAAIWVIIKIVKEIIKWFK